MEFTLSIVQFPDPSLTNALATKNGIFQVTLTIFTVLNVNGLFTPTLNNSNHSQNHKMSIGKGALIKKMTTVEKTQFVPVTMFSEFKDGRFEKDGVLYEITRAGKADVFRVIVQHRGKLLREVYYTDNMGALGFVMQALGRMPTFTK